MNLSQLRSALRTTFPRQRPPKPLDLVEAIGLVLEDGQPVDAVAASQAVQVRRLAALTNAPDALAMLLGDVSEFTVDMDVRWRSVLGQLLIGRLAESVFVRLWHESLGDGDLLLADDRSTRGDTDFLVSDRVGRQVFRLNIKFHGSRFLKARELVGLDPDDTFALATYKIHSALKKQEAEHLPYIFVVVEVRGLSAGSVGELVPHELVELVALAHSSRRVTGKRTIEDAVVARLVESPGEFAIAPRLTGYLEQLTSADWRVLSARRADVLLRDLLFERAYALRVRAFARNYSRAELDMHFSVKNDLHPLAELFQVLRDHGMPGLVSRLERGTL